MTGFFEENAPAYDASTPVGARMDKAAFCRWVEGQERKYEWKDGRVVMMNNVTRGHSEIGTNLIVLFRQLQDPRQWGIHAVDFGVETATSIRYPDIVVEHKMDDRKGKRADAPVILVEILSPSSKDRDFVEKLAEYTTFDSLEAYIVASQDDAMLWSWQRQADGSFPDEPQETTGRGNALKLIARDVALPLNDIYLGVETGGDA